MASIFSKINSGELPGHIVYKDEHCFALMNLYPCSTGHLLVIPFEEIDHWDDMPESLTVHIMSTCRKIAKALKQAFCVQRVGILVSGMDVPHVHFHLIPANVPDDLDIRRSAPVAPETLVEAAEKVRNALA